MLDNCPNFQLLVIGKVRGTRVFVISLGYRLYLPGLCWNIQCQVRGKAIQRNFRLSQPLMQRYISRMKSVIKPMFLDRAVVTAHHHFVHCHYVHYGRLSWSRSIRLTWFVACSIYHGHVPRLLPSFCYITVLKKNHGRRLEDLIMCTMT